MKKMILTLCVLLLFCGYVDAATTFGMDRLNWSQSMPIGANVTMDGGYLVDAKLGESSAEVTVGPYKWCDYVTDGANDEVQILQAVNTGKNVHLVGGLHIHTNLTIVGTRKIYGDGPGRSVITEHNTASIVFADIIKTQFSDLEVKRDLDGGSNIGTVGINIERCAPFWHSFSIFSNLYVHGSETNFILGQSWPNHVVGPIDIIDCTFGSNPSDWTPPSDKCNVSVDIRYGIEPHFTRCEIAGFNHTGILIGPEYTNNVWISECYINGDDKAKYGMHIQGGGSHTISEIGIESCTEANMYISGGYYSTISDSFFGGIGSGGKTGRPLLIKSDSGLIDTVLISNCYFDWATGLNGTHSQDSMVEIAKGVGGETAGIQFQNCVVWDNGYGAINVTDSKAISIRDCHIVDMHEVYHGLSVGGAINFMGDSARGSVQNNIIDMSNKGITIQDDSWGIMVTGNNICGTNLGGDAINITTTFPWTIINSTNYWITWAS